MLQPGCKSDNVTTHKKMTWVIKCRNVATTLTYKGIVHAVNIESLTWVKLVDLYHVLRYV